MSAALPTPMMTVPNVIVTTSEPTTMPPTLTTTPGPTAATAVTKVTIPKASNVVMDFGNFLQSQNLVGLSLGFLVAFSTMDTTKGLTRSIAMPLIEALKTFKAPQFHFGFLIEALFNFVITMLVVFLMLKVTKVAMPPAQIVQVMTR
jgi:large-conductance mechanosensitive channel